jgi:branched-subunit amino acid aminotransferase/4-amino-4-deoxychorismate lyase
MRAEAGQVPLWPAHLRRLSDSVAALGFALDRAEAERLLQEALAGPLMSGRHRVRLDWSAQGGLSLRHAPLSELPGGPVRLAWAEPTVPRGRLLARHKITARLLRSARGAGGSPRRL